MSTRELERKPVLEGSARAEVAALPEHSIERRADLLSKLSATFRALIWQGNREGAALMETIGMTLPQAAVLGTLASSGGRATMSEIAHLTYQSAASLTGIVDRLAEAGFVERERDATDRRVVYVLITQAGTDKLDEVKTERRKHMEQMTGTLTDEELEQLNTIMSKLVAPTQ